MLKEIREHKEEQDHRDQQEPTVLLDLVEHLVLALVLIQLQAIA